MSNCCENDQGFPNASLMQQISLNSPVIWQEICLIQQAILSASKNCAPNTGKMCTTVAGNTPMTFVSGINNVEIVNGGAGYYIDNPSIKFIPPEGRVPSVTAQAEVLTNGGSILSIVMTNYGQGYQPVPSTLVVSSPTGTGAELLPIVDATGSIIGVNIVSAGNNYQVGDAVVANRAVTSSFPQANADIKVSAVSASGEILSVSVLKSGQGYQPSTAQVSIVSQLDPDAVYPLGTGFSGTPAVNSQGNITQVIIHSSGAGYVPFRPYLLVNNPGTGASTVVELDNDSVSSISVIKSGSGYVLPATGTVFNPPTAGLPNPPADSAVVSIGISENVYGTNPNKYWMVWSGAETDKQIQLQLSQVLGYFSKLGYKIEIQTNADTGSTIMWRVCW